MKIPLLVVLSMAAIAIAIISGTIAFVPVYNEALDSSTNAASEFAQQVSSKVAVHVQNFLSQPVYFADALSRATMLRAMRKDNNQSIVDWLCTLVPSGPDMLLIYYYDDTTGFLSSRINTLNISIPPRANHSLTSYYDGATQTVEFRYIDDDNINFSATPYFVQKTTFNASIRPYYHTFRTAQRHRWASPFVDYSKQFADLGIGGAILDVPLNGTSSTTRNVIGVYGVFYRANTILDYFSGLQVAKTGRAFLVDASTGAYLGGSSNDPSVKTVNGSVVLATPADVRDGVERTALDGLGDRMLSCTVGSCSYTTGSGGDITYVTVTAITDSYGLNLRVVVAVPSVDFMGSIRSSMRVGLAAAGGSIAALVALSTLLLHFLLVPLKRLEQRLYAAATLRDYEVPQNEEPSSVSEIRTMQAAYLKLVTELKKVKSFLPQSVLRQLDDVAATTSDELTVSQSIAGGASGVEAVDDGFSDADGDEHNRSRTHRRSSKDSVKSSTFAGVLPPPGASPSAFAAAAYAVQMPESCSDDGSTPAREGGGGIVIGSLSTAATTMEHPHLTSTSGVHTTSTAPSPLRKHTPLANHDRTAPSPRLNLDGHLMTRRVTVAMVNLSGFHKALELLGDVELQKTHAAIAQYMLMVVNKNHGVVESFHGDRFTMSFNASLSCHTHAERACATILDIANGLTKLEVRGYTGIRFGVATGQAVCGNFGPEAMKRFSMIGTVVNQSFALMQQTKLEGLWNLVSHLTMEAVTSSGEYVAQHVNFVMLPQSSYAALISTILARRPRATVAAAQSMDDEGDLMRLRTPLPVIQKVNEAFEAFAQGDVQRCREMYSAIPREHTRALTRCLRAVSDPTAGGGTATN